MEYWDIGDLDQALDRICVAGDKEAATQFDLNRLLKDLPTKPSWKVLEVGCGVGRLLRPLREMFSVVDGVDYAGKLVELSVEYLKGYPNGRVDQNDGQTLLNFQSNSYDFVFAFTVFQHIRSSSVLASYLIEMQRVLRPGGCVRFQMHDISNPLFGRWEEDLSQVWGNAYTASELKDMMSIAGYKDIDIQEEVPWVWVSAIK